MFSDVEYVRDIHLHGGEKALLGFAKDLVYKTYLYCSEHNVNPQTQTVWVEIEFDYSTMGTYARVRVYCTDEPYI